MNKHIAIRLSTLLIAGLAAWTTFVAYQPQGTPVLTPTSIPDAFMEDVHAIMMDKQGKPKMKIVTPKMVHYPKDDLTQLTTPQLTLYRQSPQPWYVTARYATATQGIEEVDFRENVTIHHSADTDNPATLIKTPTLRVFPQKQLADTADPITMIQPNTTINAVGMHADMNVGTITLLSQARGEYVPNS